MATHEEMIEQFRKGEYIDTIGSVGFIALKHVQRIGHIALEKGQHVPYVITVNAHPLRVPAFTTKEEAQAFVEQCAAALGKVTA